MALIPLSNVLTDDFTAFRNEINGIKDFGGRQFSATRFADTVVANRTDSVSVQFMYNISDYNTKSTLTGTGTLNHSNGMAVVGSGTGVATSRLESTQSIIHHPGHESHAVFDAVFSSPDANTNQKIGPFNGEGFWFGYFGNTFGVAVRNNDTDTFIPQASWNRNTLTTGDFILDPSKLNMYRISYGWGVCPTSFEVSANGYDWVVVHVIDNRNLVTAPVIDNPYLPMAVEVESTGSVVSPSTVSTASWSAGAALADEVEASRRFISMASGTKSVTATTNTNIITIKNPATWQGKTNRISSQLLYLSVSTEGTKPVDLSFVRDATVSGTPVFSPISADNSPLEIDTAGTIVSGGTLSWGVSVAKAAQVALNTTDYMLVLPPGQQTTLQAYSTANTDVSVFLRAKDMF